MYHKHLPYYHIYMDTGTLDEEQIYEENQYKMNNLRDLPKKHGYNQRNRYFLGRRSDMDKQFLRFSREPVSTAVSQESDAIERSGHDLFLPQVDMSMYFLKHNITANRRQNTLFRLVLCGQSFGTKRPNIWLFPRDTQRAVSKQLVKVKKRAL